MTDAPLTCAADLGRSLRQRRKADGLTLHQAAALCGVSVQFLHDLETGKPTIQLDKALAVAAQLGVLAFLREKRLEGFG